MVVGRNNGLVRLTGFSSKVFMGGLLFGKQDSGRINGWSYGEFPLYVIQ